jgi:predicted DNA-binding transcriptional regulator AlpA
MPFKPSPLHPPLSPCRVTGDDELPFPHATLSASEAADYIGMSESWLRRSDVPRVRLGSRVIFMRSDLNAYLAQRRTHGSAT